QQVQRARRVGAYLRRVQVGQVGHQREHLGLGAVAQVPVQPGFEQVLVLVIAVGEVADREQSARRQRRPQPSGQRRRGAGRQVVVQAHRVQEIQTRIEPYPVVDQTAYR